MSQPALPAVQAVVINWKRPENLPAVCSALRTQTVPIRLVIVDCSPAPEFSLPAAVSEMADEVFRWRHDAGPNSRFVAGLMCDSEYTYYHDDDAVPGSRVVEHYLRCAQALGDACGVLGQMGRRFALPEGRYRPRDICRDPEKPIPVDTTVRFHFLRTEHHHAMLRLKWDLLARVGAASPLLHEDDLLLNLGIQRATGRHSYLTPDPADPEMLSVKAEMPEPESRRGRSTHREIRSQFVTEALGLGWRRTWEKPRKERTSPLKALGQVLNAPFRRVVQTPSSSLTATEGTSVGTPE